MALQMRNKRNVEFSMASMSDLVFLLLIFFMLTSTLVSPNAIKLLLPNSSQRTLAPARTVTVYINDQQEYYFETTYIAEADLQTALTMHLAKDTAATIVLKADKTVPIQSVVTLIDAVNKVNDARKTKFKVILATKQNPTEQ
jgi:biopolymer transport protein ExbD